jgi:hypothetical protein
MTGRSAVQTWKGAMDLFMRGYSILDDPVNHSVRSAIHIPALSEYSQGNKWHSPILRYAFRRVHFCHSILNGWRDGSVIFWIQINVPVNIIWSLKQGGRRVFVYCRWQWWPQSRCSNPSAVLVLVGAHRGFFCPQSHDQSRIALFDHPALHDDIDFLRPFADAIRLLKNYDRLGIYRERSRFFNVVRVSLDSNYLGTSQLFWS